MSEYKISKKIGDVGELEIHKRLIKKYPKAYIDNIGKANSDWDIFIPEINAGIEVKMDYKSLYSGNLLIEVYFNKPSALSVTKAKYWVFITGERYIWITPLEIYRFIELYQYHRKQLTGEGDEEAKIAYLIKHDDFVLYVHRLSKENGWVEMIKEDDVMYVDKFKNIDLEKYFLSL